MSGTATTTVNELVLLYVTRTSLTDDPLLGNNTNNTRTSNYPYYGTDKPVISDEIIVTLKDNYSDTTVEYYKLTTGDTNNYTLDNLPTGTTPVTLSLTDGKGKITGVNNGDKYVIVSTGKYKGEQKNRISTIVINNIRDGSKENPLTIYDLDTLRSITEGSTLYYDQTDDINLEGVMWNSVIASQFSGSYYGNNKKIENLSGTHGLFNVTPNATIDGMNIEIDDYVAAGAPFGIISRQAPYAKFSNITVTLNGTMKFGFTSGLVVGTLPTGEADHIVININGDITAEGTSVGGFAGHLYGGTKINDITVNISKDSNIVATDNNVGAVFGNIEQSSVDGVTIVNSETSLIESFDPSLNDYDTVVGGFAGYVRNSTISNINVSNKGKIIGLTEIGGIFGKIESSTVNNCSHTGSGNIIEATDGTSVGNYYGLNIGSTFDPVITTDMNEVKP